MCLRKGKVKPKSQVFIFHNNNLVQYNFEGKLNICIFNPFPPYFITVAAHSTKYGAHRLLSHFLTCNLKCHNWQLFFTPHYSDMQESLFFVYFNLFVDFVCCQTKVLT